MENIIPAGTSANIEQSCLRHDLAQSTVFVDIGERNGKDEKREHELRYDYHRYGTKKRNPSFPTKRPFASLVACLIMGILVVGRNMRVIAARITWVIDRGNI